MRHIGNLHTQSSMVNHECIRTTAYYVDTHRLPLYVVFMLSEQELLATTQKWQATPQYGGHRVSLYRGRDAIILNTLTIHHLTQ